MEEADAGKLPMPAIHLPVKGASVRMGVFSMLLQKLSRETALDKSAALKGLTLPNADFPAVRIILANPTTIRLTIDMGAT
jgi:hypothetical protein